MGKMFFTPVPKTFIIHKYLIQQLLLIYQNIQTNIVYTNTYENYVFKILKNEKFIATKKRRPI